MTHFELITLFELVANLPVGNAWQDLPVRVRRVAATNVSDTLYPLILYSHPSGFCSMAKP
jgi:hypothetical protein